MDTITSQVGYIADETDERFILDVVPDDESRCVSKRSLYEQKMIENISERAPEEAYKNTDIYGREDEENCVAQLVNVPREFQKMYLQSIFRKWIKPIPYGCFFSIKDYNKRMYFNFVANIVLDEENTKRQTLIKFVPTIDNDLFKDNIEWIYLFTINDNIVKIGGTRVGLKGRTSSYLSGHNIPERGKNGGSTNAYIYNTFLFYLNCGYKIQMYAYQVPENKIKTKIFNKEANVCGQIFHAYESKFLEDFKQQFGVFPHLSERCDPRYK
jgi:hypothetical protein